mgnify:CR=1 FL=1|jgi:hypothetical protein
MLVRRGIVARTDQLAFGYQVTNFFAVSSRYGR